jgi:glycerol uptake facilitator-like aquaporin
MHSSILFSADLSVSGAHFNPAVTLALAAARRIPLLRAAAYVPLQLLASALATYLAAMSGTDVASTFVGLPAGVNVFRAAVAEIFPMFLITLVFFQTAVASESEGGVGPRVAALYIGLVVFACASSFPGMFNPARVFGPALFLGLWNAHWIYLLPIPTAIVTGLMCEHLFIAPGAGRKPNSWLEVVFERLAILPRQVKALGVSALIGYGIANILYYGVVFTFFFLRVRFRRRGLSAA